MRFRVDIERRPLGRSTLEAPRVMLGCGNFGGVGSAPEHFGGGQSYPEACALMDAAWELGIDWFDTADAYGGGRSEETIGLWSRSNGVQPRITTKVYNPMAADADRGLAPERIERQLASSLERLGVDRVDLYLAHDFDPDVPLEDTLGKFEELRDRGLVGAYGVSNFDGAQLEQAAEIGAPACVQNGYSLLDRDPEREILPLCERLGIAFTAYGPLAGGWLAGRYRRGRPFPVGSRMTQRPEPYERFQSDAMFDSLEELERMATARGMSMAALAYAWLLADERVTAVVIGASRTEHLLPVREALAQPLAPDERDKVASVFARAAGEAASA